MQRTTYKTMGLDDLGQNATDKDLHWFKRACKARQEQTGETDEQVTQWMWGTGDYWDKILDTFLGEHPAELGAMQ